MKCVHAQGRGALRLRRRSRCQCGRGLGLGDEEVTEQHETEEFWSREGAQTWERAGRLEQKGEGGMG